MKKRGLVMQPFFYIFMIIVIAFIFLFGYRVITQVQDTGEKATYLTFKTDFTKAINTVYYYNKDSRLIYSEINKNKPLLLPVKVDNVCFTPREVTLKSKEEVYNEFEVDYLTTNLQQELCIKTINNKLSFNLTNVVYGGETFVEVSENE